MGPVHRRSARAPQGAIDKVERFSTRRGSYSAHGLWALPAHLRLHFARLVGGEVLAVHRGACARVWETRADTHARTHARTDARTHGHTHARTHARSRVAHCGKEGLIPRHNRHDVAAVKLNHQQRPRDLPTTIRGGREETERGIETD
jgi:hypothetical protein